MMKNAGKGEQVANMYKRIGDHVKGNRKRSVEMRKMQTHVGKQSATAQNAYVDDVEEC